MRIAPKVQRDRVHETGKATMRSIDFGAQVVIYLCGAAKELGALTIERDDFHGDWNYVIKARNKER